MAGFRGVAVALVVALLTTGISYAADKVTRSCSGTANHVFWSLKGEHNEQNYPYQDSLTIDLDGRVVIWGSDTYQITEIIGNHYTIGVMDRITGDLSLSQDDKCDKLGLYHKTTFNLHCKPAKPLF